MTDPAALPDSIARFAADLRLLRVSAGSPTLAHLQDTTSISRTVLSDALAGKNLPSARTVDAFARACAADPINWLNRRDALARQTAVKAEAAPAPRRVRRSVTAIIAVAALIVGATVATVTTRAAMQPDIDELQAKLVAAGPVNPEAQIVVRTGIDPAMTPCVNDAKVAASEDRTNDTRLQIVWSNKCYAGWARIARYDARAEGNMVKVSIYPETAPDGPERQDAVEPGVQGAYTTLVVRPTPQTRLCAVGSITVDGETISLGEPICT